MDVLQAAPFVIGDDNAQPGFVVLVPPAGNIGDGQTAFDQFLFQLITDHDMEMIGNLVGFGTDKGGLYLVDSLVELCHCDGAELFWENGLETGIDGLPPSVTSAYVVLPEAGVGFIGAPAGV